LILVLKKHAVRNVITSKNNSLMQSKIILIGVTYKFRIAFSGSISVIISNKLLLILARGSGRALQAPPVGSG